MNKSQGLLITGLARDVGDTIEKEVYRLRNVMLNFFSVVDFFVVESDSHDNTLLTLQRLREELDYFQFEPLGNLSLKFPDRIDRLRYCRNKYVDKFRSQESKYSHALVVDFDIKNTAFEYRFVKKVIDQQLDWDGAFANQRGKYFDILALRKKGWVSADCLSEVHELVQQGLDKERAKEIAIWNKMKKIQIKANPIEVDSAFGGMAFYKSWVFQSFDYSIEATSVKAFESEHVALNSKIRSNGGRLFIYPELVNFSWNPHNLASFKLFRKLDRISKRPMLRRLRRYLRSRLG